MMRPLNLRASLLFGALSLACGDKPGDTGKSGPVDEDGDGVVAADDCDDNNADAYPGADDVWYDGVDTDCEGNDDYDADADGVRSDQHGGADCDDADPSISPTATETWYDDIDSDCRGDNDHDADVDGFDAVASGGADCDDNDPGAWPGAPDTWYDGIDSDCNGASDYDADTDGHDSIDGGGDDCDDSDPDINPEIVETWYDAVDSDCGGDDDYDADGDGSSSAEYGGDDCNDADAETLPGAQEQLDGHDTDCDGTADSFSVESDYGGIYILGGEEDAYFGAVVETGDVDGDGLTDIAAVQWSDAVTSIWGNGIIHLFYGASLGMSPTTTASADVSIETSYDSYTIDALAILGDQGGDGTAELVAGSPLAYFGEDTPGAVYLLTSDVLGSATDVEDAALVITGAYHGGNFGEAVADIGDIDGDGLNDLAIGAPDADEVAIWLSSSLSTTGWVTSDDSDALWSSTSESNDSLGAALEGAGDVDGDGRDDVLVGAPGWSDSTGATLLILGSGSPSTADATTAAAAILTGANEGDRFGSTIATGDMNGDGTTDVAIGAPFQTTRIGRVHVVDGTAFTSGTADVSSVSYADFIGGTTFGYTGTAIASGGDVNGDGSDDMVIGGPGDSGTGGDAGAVWIEVSGRVGSRALADADVSFMGGSDDDFSGIAVGLGDINGDGAADAVFGVPGEDNLGNEGAVYVGYSGW